MSERDGRELIQGATACRRLGVSRRTLEKLVRLGVVKPYQHRFSAAQHQRWYDVAHIDEVRHERRSRALMRLLQVKNELNRIGVQGAELVELAGVVFTDDQPRKDSLG